MPSLDQVFLPDILDETPLLLRRIALEDLHRAIGEEGLVRDPPLSGFLIRPDFDPDEVIGSDPFCTAVSVFSHSLSVSGLLPVVSRYAEGNR